NTPWAALRVILQTHPHRQVEQVGKAFLEGFVARDLAPDVADHAAQPNAQELERAPGPLELVRMRIAPDHERGALGDAPVALPKWHIVAPRQIDQFFSSARWHSRASVGYAIALGCTVVSTTTRSRSWVASAPIFCATDGLSWMSA